MSVNLSVKRQDRVVITQYCPQQPYVEILLPKNVQAVQKIIFIVDSHDQGYCSDKDAGSWSWFEAHFSRPSARNMFLPRTIQTNAIGEWERKEYIITWTSDDTNPEIRSIVLGLQEGDCIQVFPKARFRGWQNHVFKASIEVHCSIAPHNQPSLPDRGVSPYSYQPLEERSKEIRLLYLNSGEKQDEVSGRLVTVSMNDFSLPPFECLSYCWGGLNNQKNMKMLSGSLWDSVAAPSVDLGSKGVHTLKITANLEEALRYIRHPRNVAPRLLWVDAVCINQNSSEERSSQVQIMGEIYAMASAVVVWLGTPDDTALKAVQVLREDFTGYEHGKSTKDTRIPLPYSDTLTKAEWEQRYPVIINSLTHFFNYPWFRRAWVVQELWLSKRASILCGNESVSWDSIMLANYWMNGGGGPGFAWAPLPPLWTSVAENQQILAAQPRIRWGRSQVTKMTTDIEQMFDRPRLKICDLVLESLELRATDPRDKIFALLGLGEETHSRNRISHHLLPNYHKSVGQVYSDFTRWWIETYKSLAILSAIHANTGRTWQNMSCSDEMGSQSSSSSCAKPAKELEKHPSWAITHSGNVRWAVNTLGLQPHYQATGLMHATLMDLDTCSPQNTNPQTNNLRIVLAGERLGRIIEISPFPHPFENQLVGDDDDLDMRSAFMRIFDPSGQLGIWNATLTLGANQEELAISSEDLKDHQSAHNHELGGEGTTRGAQIIEQSCFSNCFFQLKTTPPVSNYTPKLSGLCPYGARVGDLVVLLYGGTVPYILREEESSLNLPAVVPPSNQDEASRVNVAENIGSLRARNFSFVGECYVKGQMDGEAFRTRQGTGLAIVEWFTLE